MIFLGDLTKIEDNKYNIGYMHFMPFDAVNGLNKTKEELELNGVLIESMPENNKKENQTSIPYWNPIDKIVFYEYNNIIPDIESSLDLRLVALEQSNAELTNIIAAMTMPTL